jgi:signal transduction histidine kinase
VWLRPAMKQRKLAWFRPPLIAAVVTLPVCGALVLAPGIWPNPFGTDGAYYWWAKALNIVGGAGFAVAAVFFLRRSRSSDHPEADRVFGNHCLIFALAGFLFGLSYLWNAVWWLFHLMRLAAYVIVLKYSFDVFRRAIKESAELRQIEFERRLIGIVGHDLRNPLNAVLLSSQLLQNIELPAKATPILQRMINAGERMNRLIGELLDFSHSRSAGTIPIHRSEIDLHSLCATVREEFAASHPNIAMACDCKGDASGRWDRDRLHQMLVNLVENAIKHGDQTTPVSIRTEGNGDKVILEVQSRGNPIPPDLLPHIFQPFRSGGARTRSHGLGLFIVNEIVRGHDGEIFVESDEQRTCFRVVLPRDGGER